jgi:hypothetical protein
MKNLFLLLAISLMFNISYGQRYRSGNQSIKSYNQMKVDTIFSGIKVTTNHEIFCFVGVFKITFTDESILTIKNKETIKNKSKSTTHFDLTAKQNSLLRTKEIKNWTLVFNNSRAPKYNEEKPPSPKFVMDLLN